MADEGPHYSITDTNMELDPSEAITVKITNKQEAQNVQGSQMDGSMNEAMTHDFLMESHVNNLIQNLEMKNQMTS